MDLKNLETKCSVCDGRGRVKAANPGLIAKWLADGDERCSACKGKGGHLTPDGRVLASFIIRHITTDGCGLDLRG